MSQGNIEDLANEILSLGDEIVDIELETLHKGGNVKMATIIRLEEQLKTAREDYQKFASPYEERAQENREIIEDAKEIILTEMIDLSVIEMTQVKNLEYDFGTVSRRTTKSLQVLDTASVVGVLTKNNKIDEGISKFNLKYLRTLEEAGILDKSQVGYDYKHSVYVKRTEQPEEAE